MDSLVLLHSSRLSAMEDYDHQDSVECQMKVFHFDDDVNDEILITFTNTLGNELSMGSRSNSNSNSSSSRFDSAYHRCQVEDGRMYYQDYATKNLAFFQRRQQRRRIEATSSPHYL